MSSVSAWSHSIGRSPGNQLLVLIDTLLPMSYYFYTTTQEKS